MNSFIEDLKEHCQKNPEVRVNSGKLLQFVECYELMQEKLAEFEKQEPVAAAPNELKHCLQVKRPSDQSVQLVFASTRTASLFEQYALEKIKSHKLTKP